MKRTIQTSVCISMRKKQAGVPFRFACRLRRVRALPALLMSALLVVLVAYPREATAQESVDDKPATPIVSQFGIADEVPSGQDPRSHVPYVSLHTVDDYAQGEIIPFVVAGTMPSDISKEQAPFAYWLVVSLPDGLAYAGGSVVVTLVRKDGSTQEVTELLEVRVEDRTLRVGTDDVLATIPGIAYEDVLELTYQARLNDAAGLGFGSGNLSVARVEYGDVSAGLEHSTELLAMVYTYRIVVRKVSPRGAPLAGARLALREVSGLWYVRDGGWSVDKVDATTCITDDQGTAIFARVDSERYEVVELEAPDGYAVVDPVAVALSRDFAQANATLSASCQGGQVQGVDASTGEVVVAIVDPTKSAELPEKSVVSQLTPNFTPTPASGPAAPTISRSTVTIAQSQNSLASTRDRATAVLPLILVSIMAMLCAAACSYYTRPTTAGGHRDADTRERECNGKREV